MSNGNKYSSTHVSNVRLKELREQFKGKNLILGVDVAKQEEYAALANKKGEIQKVIDWEHPEESRVFADLVDGLESSQIQMVVEPTGNYGDPLRYLAYERGWEVWRMASKGVHDSKEFYDGVPSIHDTKAAHMLVWLHTQRFTNRWWPREVGRREVKAYTKRVSRLQLQWQRHLGYLESEMARYWPEIIQVWELKRATLLGLLEKFGGPEQIARREGEVKTWMKQKGGPFLKEQRIEEVLEAARESLGVGLVEAERKALQKLAADTDQIRRARKEMKRELKNLIYREDSLEEVRQIGEVTGLETAAVYWVKIGSFLKYSSTDELIKAFGLNFGEFSSGEYQSPVHITKRGPASARCSLYLATWRIINRDHWFQAWHYNKLQRDGGVEKADKDVSVVALMRKYLEGLWHVARGREFDSSELFNTEKLKTA